MRPVSRIRCGNILTMVALSAVLTACSSAPAASIGPPPPLPIEAGFAEGQAQKIALATDIRWRPCPPAMPPGCQMAVLEGNPRERQLFTLRVKSDRPFRLPVHIHPAAERVTVLSGKISVGFGDKLDTSKGMTFGVGDYYVNAPGTPHYVWAEEPVVVQITGIGPWEVEYLHGQN